jgi:hypothetical protein
MEMADLHLPSGPAALARFLLYTGRRYAMKSRKTATASGLCATCEKAGVCTYPNRNAHPVMHCLEFEEATMADEPPAPRAWRLTVEKGIQELSPAARGGLCATCDLRAACTFPRGPEGSWFCEEYR